MSPPSTGAQALLRGAQKDATYSTPITIRLCRLTTQTTTGLPHPQGNHQDRKVKTLTLNHLRRMTMAHAE